jgi:hypothetical protein
MRSIVGRPNAADNVQTEHYAMIQFPSQFLPQAEGLRLCAYGRPRARGSLE